MSAIRLIAPGLFGAKGATRIVERNVLVYRRVWPYLVTGFFEPFFYLLSIGLGLSHLVGSLHIGDRVVSYPDFVAPGLLASSAMNGALFDSTFNIYFKLKIVKTYDAVLATPLRPRDIANGELIWALMRAGLYSGAFLAVMAGFGYVLSPWMALAYPVALLISFAFASTGMAATSYMRTWEDFDKVSLTILPLFLFSATFYPLSVYPGWLQEVVRFSPLYQGVAILRALDAGAFSWTMGVHCAYLAVMGTVALRITARRFAQLLTP